MTRSLIHDSSSVLQTQIDKQGELGTFSKNLALLSDSLVEADPDLRRLFDKGSDSAATLNAVVKENSADLGNAIRDLITSGKPLSENVSASRRSSSSIPTWSRAPSRCWTRCQAPTTTTPSSGSS